MGKATARSVTSAVDRTPRRRQRAPQQAMDFLLPRNACKLVATDGGLGSVGQADVAPACRPGRQFSLEAQACSDLAPPALPAAGPPHSAG